MRCAAAIGVVAEWCAVAARVDEDVGIEAGAVREQHRAPAVDGADDAAGDDPDPGRREARVEVMAERGHVEHGVRAVEARGT